MAPWKPEDGHLRHFLFNTSELTGLYPVQRPIPSLGEVGDFTQAESTILPLLCFMTQAIAATIKAVEERRLLTSKLKALSPKPCLMVQTTLLNLTRSSLACVTCHIG